jgi:uncharacterized membrane-anchored protein YhcB (DUF1043 family)
LEAKEIFNAALLVVIGIVVGIIGFFLKRLIEAHDSHDKKDDVRFDRLDAKIDAFKEDMITKRHNLRAEMRDAFASEYEHREKLGDELRDWIKRVEDKVDKHR